MRYFRSSLFTLVCFFVGASQASAESITYELNCAFPSSAGSACTTSGSFGTVTLMDSTNVDEPNALQVIIDLVDPWRTSSLYLNLLPGALPADYTFWTPVGANNNVNNVTYAENDKGNTGLAYLDIAVRASKSSDPITLTFGVHNNTTDASGKLIYYNLDPSMFAVLSNDPALNTPVFLAVNRQYCPGGICGATFSMVGATPVPEPASLLLLGSGLSALVLRARRRVRNQQKDG